MTAPTEAEIRAFLEDYPADNWTLEGDYLANYTAAAAGAFQDFIEHQRVTDDDFDVFGNAYAEEIAKILPAVNATLRPLMIEATTRATVRFFERFPHVPLAKDAVPA